MDEPDLDVIEQAPASRHALRRIVVVAVLVAGAVLGYAVTRPGTAHHVAALVRPPARPVVPVPAALVESARRGVATAGSQAGGGLGVRTSNGPTAVSAQGATPGTYQVSLICIGTGTVTVFLSDGPPGEGPASAQVACTADAGPAVTVNVTLRQPAFALLAAPADGTVAGLGWSVRRV